MFKNIKSILFATNLSKNCIPAFDLAVSLATRFEATIILLHVIEKMPNYIEGRLKGLLGDFQWKEMLETHEKDARKALIGKRSANIMIHDALQQFCNEAGVPDDSCGYNSREIVVSEGDVVEEIISQSTKSKCDMIIMGTREGFFTESSIGPTVKAVLRKSKIPVVVVPPVRDETAVK